MMNKICTGKEAMALVKDGDFLACGGNMNSSMPEELLVELEKRFLETGEPKNLTINSGSGIGDMGSQTSKGFQHLAHEGLLKRVIVGHYGSNSTIMKMVTECKVESYNFPQGVIEHWFKARAAGKDYEITKVGLGTFVDPRMEGGKANAVTKEDLVRLVEIDGEEYMAYKTPLINVAVIRGTTADEFGNISCEEEAAFTNTQAIAMATKASGGIVIAQVKNIVNKGAIPAKEVHVPGIFVDKIVVCRDFENNHRQTMGDFYNAAFTGKFKIPLAALSPLPLGAQKIICRRAAFELKRFAPINTGLGIPEGIPAIAAEEGVADDLVLTVETGAIGGVPASRFSFGATTNAQCMIDSPTIFDLYDGGSLYATFLGAAQINAFGDVNVSCFVDNKGVERRPGAGGFINLTQGARNVVFCGTMNAGGFKASAENGRLKIIEEGSEKKFVNSLHQITFSGNQAMKNGQNVLYITERCVFRLVEGGLRLVEVAEGIDVDSEILAFMEYRPQIADTLETMNPLIFQDHKIGLRAIL